MAEAATLHHFAFDPSSRAARLALGEVRLAFTETAVRPWEPDSPIHALTPSGLPPARTRHAPGERLGTASGWAR